MAEFKTFCHKLLLGIFKMLELKIALFVAMFIISLSLTILFMVSLRYMINRTHIMIYSVLTIIMMIMSVGTFFYSVEFIKVQQSPEYQTEKVEREEIKQEECEQPKKYYGYRLKTRYNRHMP